MIEIVPSPEPEGFALPIETAWIEIAKIEIARITAMPLVAPRASPTDVLAVVAEAGSAALICGARRSFREEPA
jgi:hypothetical protein